MRSLIIGLLIFCSIMANGNDLDLKNIRTLYEKAATEQNSCKELIELLSTYDEKNNPLFFGYKAGATMIMAKYTYNPLSKLSYFNKGKDMLQKALEADAKNIELHFLRFTIQTNAPSFLGYNGNLETDKDFLMKNLTQFPDKTFAKFIAAYLKNSDYLTSAEKQKLISEFKI